PPMNFVPATVDGDRVQLPFASIDLPAGAAPEVGDGRLLIAGIRPEHFEDAALVDEAKRARGVTFTAEVDVTEWLGSELFAYIPFDAPPEVTERLRSLARELDSEALRSQLVVSLDPSSRIARGDEAELWFDAGRVHLFDPVSGTNLTREAAAVG
ncbi:MAG: ABC transporter ATP-binding protein, partial [Actinomycetota bacterium]